MELALVLFAPTIVSISLRTASAAFPKKPGKSLSAIPRNLSTRLHSVEAPLDLQSSHCKKDPSELFHSLGEACTSLGIEEFDAYGDFQLGEIHEFWSYQLRLTLNDFFHPSDFLSQIKTAQHFDSLRMK